MTGTRLQVIHTHHLYGEEIDQHGIKFIWVMKIIYGDEMDQRRLDSDHVQTDGMCQITRNGIAYSI